MPLLRFLAGVAESRWGDCPARGGHAVFGTDGHHLHADDAAALLRLPPVWQVPGYNCPASCGKKPNCHCASHDIPGKLTPNQTPQFVVLVSGAAMIWPSCGI